MILTYKGMIKVHRRAGHNPVGSTWFSKEWKRICWWIGCEKNRCPEQPILNPLALQGDSVSLGQGPQDWSGTRPLWTLRNESVCHSVYREFGGLLYIVGCIFPSSWWDPGIRLSFLDLPPVPRNSKLSLTRSTSGHASHLESNYLLSKSGVHCRPLLKGVHLLWRKSNCAEVSKDEEKWGCPERENSNNPVAI